MAKIIPVSAVVWSLGDRESVTLGGLTNLTKLIRPLYYQPKGAARIGSINPDYAEPLMAALAARD